MIHRPFQAVLLLCCFVGGVGCEQGGSTPAASASSEASQPSPPKLEVTDAAKHLLLTWVDEQGDFHVVQKVSDVPDTGRKQVRVVDSKVRGGTSDWVYVADLTQQDQNGRYAVKTMPRAQWDEIGASRRKKRLEALAPSATPPSASAPPSGAASAPNPQMGSKVSAIVYGADWCKPCHAAEAYLKKRGIHVIKKDIEDSDAARAEMQTKLDRAGMGGAQIPIIDVMGQLLVGYSPAALDRAIQSARKSKTL